MTFSENSLVKSCGLWSLAPHAEWSIQWLRSSKHQVEPPQASQANDANNKMQITQVTSGKTDDMSVLDWVKTHCFSLELFVCLLLQPLIAVDT